MCDSAQPKRRAFAGLKNRPREKGSFGQRPKRSRGDCSPVHAAKRFDGPQMAMKAPKVKNLARCSNDRMLSGPLARFPDAPLTTALNPEEALRA